MAIIMKMVNLKNNVHRSGFDLSRRNCFTAKVGEIIPVMCEEVLPGDKWKINMREFMRTAPVQTASFGRVRQYYDFYFVPYNLLWDKWESWIMQTKQAFHAKSIMASADEFPTHPYMSMNEMLALFTDMQDHDSNYYLDYSAPVRVADTTPVYDGTSRLMSYLGYPLTKSSGISGDLALNPFPVLAYQKIYQDYFRFSQWEDAAPWTYNLDYVLSSGALKLQLNSIKEGRSANIPNMFTLRYCSLDKDYFNGLLPTPQYGDTSIAGPLNGLGLVANGGEHRVDFSFTLNKSNSASTAHRSLVVPKDGGRVSYVASGSADPNQVSGVLSGSYTYKGSCYPLKRSHSNAFATATYNPNHRTK